MKSKPDKKWNKVELGTLFDPLKRKNQEGEKRVLTVSGEHGLIDQAEYFDRNIASKSLTHYWLLKKGEFTYNRSFMNGFPFGAIKPLVRYDKGCVSPIYLCFFLKDKKTADASFYSYIFESGILNGQLASIAHAGARAHGMLNVCQEEFFEMVVQNPPIEEQKKIAKILSTWDLSLERLTNLIDAKTRLKKGLTQKMMMGRMRLSRYGKTVKKGGMNLPDGWKNVHLNDFADVLFSNVDKKSLEDQKAILLCNYMDVYKNRYLTKSIDYMKATASNAEIKKFKVLKGDVVITKDSETPIDIGIPAVALDDMEGLICGYHLAIIRPDLKELDPIYLLHQLMTHNVRKQFYKYANGATRFGLGTAEIKKIEIIVPKLPEQKEIASIMQSLDRGIQILTDTKVIIECQKKSLMQKLLTGKIRVCK